MAKTELWTAARLVNGSEVWIVVYPGHGLRACSFLCCLFLFSQPRQVNTKKFHSQFAPSVKWFIISAGLAQTIFPWMVLCFEADAQIILHGKKWLICFGGFNAMRSVVLLALHEDISHLTKLTLHRLLCWGYIYKAKKQSGKKTHRGFVAKFYPGVAEFKMQVLIQGCFNSSFLELPEGIPTAKSNGRHTASVLGPISASGLLKDWNLTWRPMENAA